MSSDSSCSSSSDTSSNVALLPSRRGEGRKRKRRRQSTSSESDDASKRKHKHKHKDDKKKKKRKHSIEDPLVSSSDKKRHSTTREKEKKRKKKHKHTSVDSSYSSKKRNKPLLSPADISSSKDIIGPSIRSMTAAHQSIVSQEKAVPILIKPRSYGPMTQRDHVKEQSIVRRVVDPDTGRSRLVKGDGEIIEEIVSRDRHKAINKLATQGDGASFQAGLRKYN